MARPVRFAHRAPALLLLATSLLAGCTTTPPASEALQDDGRVNGPVATRNLDERLREAGA